MSNKLLLNLSNSLKTSKQNKLPTLDVKFSKKILSIISVLLKEGLIRGYFLKNKYVICVLLKYVDDENMVNFKNISLVNQRVYCASNFIKNSYTSFNCSIISTRKGVLSHRQALNHNLGGFPLLNFS
jgi:ribosomal protein S8